MKPQELLRRINGWERLGILLTFAWLILSSALYNNGLNRDFSFVDIPSPSPRWKPIAYDYRPKWSISWDMHVASTFKLPYLYDWQSHYLEVPNYFGTNVKVLDHYNTTFSVAGFISFLLLPIGLIWGGYYAIIWVAHGFRLSK